MRQHNKAGIGSHCYNRHLISPLWRKTTYKKHDLEAVWKELIDELAGPLTNPTYKQTNITDAEVPPLISPKRNLLAFITDLYESGSDQGGGGGGDPHTS